MEESKKNMQKVYKNGYKQFKRGKNITIGNCGAFFTKLFIGAINNSYLKFK